MWENAAPLPENEPPRPPARCAGSEEDLVLWAQILLCLAAIGLVLAAGALDWPVYPELRRAFTAAMQPEQSLLLGEERNLLKFTEQTAGELADSARSMWEDFTLPATPESARTAHGQPSPPAYARTDSYTPGFPLQFPLPGQSRKTSGYGWRTDPMGGLGDDFHIGNDLAAAQGTPVLAGNRGLALRPLPAAARPADDEPAGASAGCSGPGGQPAGLCGSAGLHAHHGLYLWRLLVRLLQSAGGRQQSAAPARPGRCAYCRVSVAFWPKIGYNKRTH